MGDSNLRPFDLRTSALAPELNSSKANTGNESNLSRLCIASIILAFLTVMLRGLTAFYYWTTRTPLRAAQATILLAYWWILSSIIQKLWSKITLTLLAQCK